MRNRYFRSRLLIATGAAMVLGLASLAAGSAQAQPPVTIDGNITDLIHYARTVTLGCGLITDDPIKDLCNADPTQVPCNTVEDCGYFKNGFDAVLVVVVYDAVGGDTYLGFRAAGSIGDSDGDGDPGKGGFCANPGANLADFSDIAAGESYQWWFDMGNDGTVDIRVVVQADAVTVMPPAGATTYAFAGTDLEVKVSGLSLPGPWKSRSFSGSITEALSEDATVFAEPTVGTCSPVPTEPGTWGRVKAHYR